MTAKVIPFSLKDAPSLIEHVLPVQRLSVDVFKERMAGSGQTLTGLGSYWKGRKPLILNKACILGSLLPITSDPKKDLEIFELLMSMDDISLSKRIGLPKPKDVIANASIADIWKFFEVRPEGAKSLLPSSAPCKIDDCIAQLDSNIDKIVINWRQDITEDQKHELASRMLLHRTYRDSASSSLRPEEIHKSIHTHIWQRVNQHLGTDAANYPELVEQLGVMRFGRKPVFADTFSGSGQIPFEAARLGCDVNASDLNPIACMLTWGAFNLIGASPSKKADLISLQKELIKKVRNEIDSLGIETDGSGWRGKVYLYCLEVTCPSSGWKVPVLPTLLVSKSKKVVAKLIPDFKNKKYEIDLIHNASKSEMDAAKVGTYQDQCIVHTLNGEEHKTKLSTIRGDYIQIVEGQRVNKNKLRLWSVDDFKYHENDIYGERLYAILWVKDDHSTRPETEFRSVSSDDILREQKIDEIVRSNLTEWQSKGLVPDSKIEPGQKTDEPIRTRGWTYWHHLFNPRQLLTCAILQKNRSASQAVLNSRLLNRYSKLCGWEGAIGYNSTSASFVNQALNTLFMYGCRGWSFLEETILLDDADIQVHGDAVIENIPANEYHHSTDIFVTDPPYGDAVKYEEILEFFISWIRKNPPAEFKNWVWDSRRALAIKGEDHDFKLSMVNAYKNMTQCMPDNGIQIVMFTHQSGSIWADMANIVWASGLKVSAAWYIVTETDSALRDGQYVKGTILLVLRKRVDRKETFRDELAYEIKEEVENQVELLSGLNTNVKDLYRDENLFEDADIQMAGYAAALRVLTKYTIIDGVEMAKESLRPRVKDQKTLVDELIDFAVDIANQYLVPQGLNKSVWDDLLGAERFYLKMLDMESKGINVLSNYQNFAKAFKVTDFSSLIGETKANKTQLKTAEIFGKRYMSSADEFGLTNTRNILYGTFMLIESKLSSDDILHQLKELIPDFYRKRDQLIAISDYISKKTSGIRENESQSARVLRDLIRNERA
jgi:putative DNA methylase